MKAYPWRTRHQPDGRGQPLLKQESHACNRCCLCKTSCRLQSCGHAPGVQVYDKPAPEVAIDTDNFLPPAPKDVDDEETASWCGPGHMGAPIPQALWQAWVAGCLASAERP